MWVIIADPHAQNLGPRVPGVPRCGAATFVFRRWLALPCYRTRYGAKSLRLEPVVRYHSSGAFSRGASWVNQDCLKEMSGS